jgi:hypothetical protein
MSRSGFSATPPRWLGGQDGTVVVELAAWRDTTTGIDQGNATVASQFRFDDGRRATPRPGAAAAGETGCGAA